VKDCDQAVGDHVHANRVEGDHMELLHGLYKVGYNP
jgi:hypothetical protein